MAIDNSFMIKRFERFESIYVLFSNATKMPFLVCDDEAFDDRVFVFTDEERAKDAARSYTNDSYEITIGKIEKRGIEGFVSSLHLLGANMVVVQDEGAPVEVELEKLCAKPDIEALRADRIPRANPELQLTACYFLQELRRRVEKTNARQKYLRELEEEMAHNLVKSRFIVSFDTSQIKGKWDPKNKMQMPRIPLLKRSDGSVFQPVYTDFEEFRKFSAKNNQGARMNLIAAPYEKLAGFLHKDSKGFALNPGGFNLILTKEQLTRMKESYGL